MIKKTVRFLCILSLLVSMPIVQAQDEASCNFELEQNATAFDDLNVITDAGIAVEDVKNLAALARTTGDVDLRGELLKKGYDAAAIDAFLDNPENAGALDRAVRPSPSSDILNRAYALLESYGLTSGALVELYPLTSDYQAFYDNVLARGLSPEQAEGLAAGSLALAEEARTLGVFEYAATLDGQDLLDRFGYTGIGLNEVSGQLDDADALRQELLLEGVTEADVDQLVSEFVTLRDESGLTSSYIDAWETENLTYTMEYYGIPSGEAISLASLGNPETVSDCLLEAGLDPDILDNALLSLDIYLFGNEEEEAVLDAEQIVEVALLDAGEFGLEWGLSGEDLAYFSQYIDDPEALIDLLVTEFGLSEDDAEMFADGFTSSIFAEVFGELDEEESIGIDEAIIAIENGETLDFADDDDTGDDGSDDTGDDSGSDDTGSDSDGDDTGTDGGGDDTGDDGSDDTGGGDDTGSDGGGDDTGGDGGGDDTGGDGGGDDTGGDGG